MKLSYGKLLFEPGDILRVEDSLGKENFIVAQGHDCEKCAFRVICDRRNPENRIAKYCSETHFESQKA